MYALSVSEDTLVIAFDFYYDADMTGAYTVDLKTKNADGEEDITFISFLRFDVKNGKLMNSVFDSALNNGEGAYILTDYEGFAPAVDTWHRVVMVFNAAENKYSFKISTDGEESWHISEDFAISASEFTKVELKPYLEGRTNTDKISIYLDDVSVYAGTFERYPERKSEIVDKTILDLEALYLADGADSQTKMRIADVFGKLAEYGYASTDETVIASLSKAPVYINLAYAEEVIKRAAAIDKTLGYHDRVDYINESLAYAKNIPADDVLETAPGFADDAELAAGVKAARAAFAEEQAECDLILTDSTAFQLKMKTYDAQNKSYEYMKTFYGEVTAIVNVDYTFAGDVEGAGGYTMEQAKLDFDAFLEKYGRINALVTVFVEGTDKMLGAVDALATYAPGDAEYEDAFGALSEGYFAVLEIINSDATADTIELDAELDETTIDRFTDRNKVCFDNEAFILANMEVCDGFVGIMNQASAASYYTAKLKYFALAKEIYDSVDENGKPKLRIKAYGVVDSVADYKALEKYISDAQTGAAAYIKAVGDAVAVIENSESSFQAKLDAIDAAKALKENGDVNGIDGVTEANANLSKYTTYLESVIADSARLVAIIPEIKSAETFAERRALLVEAAKAAANCETSLEGVSEALTSFAEQKAAYETVLAAMNTAHVSATVNAFASSAAAAGDAEVYTATDILAQYVAYINE